MSVDVSGLRDEVARLMRKAVFALKEDKALYVALKAKLTKKEMKILLGQLHGTPKAELCERLKLDEARYEALYDSLVKKLNSERIKQLLYSES